MRIQMWMANELEAFTSGSGKRMASDKAQFVQNLGMLLYQTSAEVDDIVIDEFDVLHIIFTNGEERTVSCSGMNYLGIMRAALIVLRREGY